MTRTPEAPLKVFVSSPSGMENDRAVVLREIRTLSNQETLKGNPVLSIVQWPNDIAAGVADYGQSVINRQTDDYDILVCLIGTWMGTSTPRAASGTEEEFDRAIASALSGRALQVLLFFNNTPVQPQSLDPNQLILVRAFRNKAERLGVLYHMFNGHNELRQRCRLSLREAYDHVRNASDVSRYRPPFGGIATTRSIRTIELDNVVLTARSTAPQWADTFLIPMAAYRRQNIRLTGVLHTSSPYFRFGFKYFDSREPLLSAGSIQTVGQNILVHLGKNVDSPTWFLTRYRAGYRLGPNQPLEDTAGRAVAHFALDITSSDNIVFSLDDKPLYEAFFPIDGLPTLALMAWGDEHEFVCHVDHLTLHVPDIVGAGA